jgi:hypothetical protein
MQTNTRHFLMIIELHLLSPNILFNHTPTNLNEVHVRYKSPPPTFLLCPIVDGWTMKVGGMMVWFGLVAARLSTEFLDLPTMNQHPPVHCIGWMISGHETVFCWVPVP